MVLLKHSGRHAFRDRIITLGYELTDEEIDIAFLDFKDLAEKKKAIFDEDILTLIEKSMIQDSVFMLDKYDIVSRKGKEAKATVRILFNRNVWKQWKKAMDLWMPPSRQ